MKAPWSADVELMVRRPDSPAQLLLEAAVATKGDIKQTKTQWDAADSTAGLDTNQNDGTVRLPVLAQANLIVNANPANAFATDLDGRDGLMDCLRVELFGAQAAETELYDLTLYLDPAQGGPKTVVQWEVHIYLQQYDGQTGITSLLEITDYQNPTRVLAGGAAADVTFTFGSRPRPFAYGSLGAPVGYPFMYVEVRGILADGSAANHIGLGVDTTTPGGVITGLAAIKTTRLIDQSDRKGSWAQYIESAQASTPKCQLRLVSGLVAATITFSGAGNRLNLGAVPTNDVELVAWGEIPTGSSIVYEIRNPTGPGPWTAFKDGDSILGIGLALRQDYDVRATLNPGAGGTTTPILRAMGAREIVTYNLFGVIEAHDVSWTIDPVEGKGEIPEARFTALRDGDPDARDLATLFLSNYDTGSIELRLFVGSLRLSTGGQGRPGDAALIWPRNKWLLLGTFQLNEWRTLGAGIELIGIGYGERLRKKVPVFDDAANTRSPLIYPLPPATSATLKDVWDDLIAGQIGVPARYIGPGPQAAITDNNGLTWTPLVSKIIDDSDGKEELNAIAYLAGGGIGERQGRLTFVDLYGAKRPIRTIAREDIEVGAVSPGLSQRVPEFFVKYGYDWTTRKTTKKYAGEVHSTHATALTKLGVAALDPNELPDIVCQWLSGILITTLTRSGGTVTATTNVNHNFVSGLSVNIWGTDQSGYNGVYVITVLNATQFTYTIIGTPATPGTGPSQCDAFALAIGKRHTQALGMGLISAAIRTIYPYPELDLGDMIAIQTDRFIGRDVQSSRAITGKIWMLGVIVGIHDAWHTQFTLWIRSYADLVAGNEAAVRLGFALPEMIDIHTQLNNTSGTVSATFKARDAKGLKYAVSTAGYPSRATVQAASPIALDASGNYISGTLATLTAGQTLFISALAYENADGTGAESLQLMQVACSPFVAAVSWLSGSTNHLAKWQDATTITTSVATDDGSNFVVPEPLTVISTTSPQASVKYDASNRLDIAVTSAGAVTMTAVGAGAALTLANAVTVSGLLTGANKLVVGTDPGGTAHVRVGGDVQIGTTTAANVLIQQGANARVRVLTDQVAQIGISVFGIAADPIIGLARGSGTIASQAYPNSADLLGGVQFYGFTPGGYIHASVMRVFAGSTWTVTNQESFMVWSTTSSGSVAHTGRWGISSAGHLQPMTVTGTAADNLYTVGVTGSRPSSVFSYAGDFKSNVTLSVNDTAYVFTDASGSHPQLKAQADNNLVLYTTDAGGSQAAIWNVNMRSNTRQLQIPAAGGVSITNDLSLNTLGTFDHDNGGAGNPATDQLLTYNGTKWVSRTVQLSFNSGVMIAATLGDGSSWTGANSNPSLSGAPSAPGAAPVVTAIYGGFIVDMTATVLPANTVYVLDYARNGGAYTSGAIIATSGKIVHSLLNNNTAGVFSSTDTFTYKFKLRGGSDSAYSPASGAQSYSTKTEVNAFGLIAASQISCQNLAALAANLGVITAGRIDNLSSSPTHGLLISSGFSVPASWTKGIFFAGANPVPGTVTGPYIDFTATGTNLWLNGPSGNVTVDASGNVNIKGLLYVQCGTSTTMARVVGVIAQSGNFTSTATVEASIYSISIKANSLVADKQAIRVTIRGALISGSGAAGRTASLHLTFDGQDVFSAQTMTFDYTGGGSIRGYVFTAVIMRTSSNHQTVLTDANWNTDTGGGVGTKGTLIRNTMTVTDSADKTLDVRGNVGNGADTLDVDMVEVEYLAA